MIDPELEPFISRVQAAWRAFPDLAAQPLAFQRQAAEQVRSAWTQGGPVMAVRETLRIGEHGDHPIRARLMTARDTADPQPVLVYLHGGGFTTFSIDTHDRIMREYAARAGIAVLGLDYALSPEAKYPVALDQVAETLDWLAAEGAGQGLDASRIAIGGGSAGANLALAACLRLRDKGEGERIAAALFAYGFFDDDFSTASHRLHGGDDKILTSNELAAFIDHYLGGTPHRDDPLALPARAELHDLPPSFHIIAECDPLADSDRVVADRMAAAGNDVKYEIYPGAVHSFLEAVSISSLANRAFAQSAAWLAERLGAAASPR